jgi:hypothetical protein
MSSFPALIVLTQLTTGEGLPWWTAAAGIIAVPTGLLVLVHSYVVIKKTRLETQKFELEIREKETELAGARDEGDIVRINQLVAQPILQGRRVQEILLRAILLILALQAWRLVEIIFGAFTTSIGYGLSSITTRSPSSDIMAALITSSIAQLPMVGYWLVFFALGGPLLVDVLRQLNISAPKLLTSVGRPSRLTYIVVAVLVLATILLTPLLIFLNRVPTP